jgi:hypothetical protein
MAALKVNAVRSILILRVLLFYWKRFRGSIKSQAQRVALRFEVDDPIARMLTILWEFIGLYCAIRQCIGRILLKYVQFQPI